MQVIVYAAASPTCWLVRSRSPVWRGRRPRRSADPRTQPATAIAEAIRLLEAKEYARFLETFSRPGDLTEMLATRKMDDLVAEFASERSPDILAALKAASGMQPTVSQDGLRVDYRFEKPFGREKRISMVKIGEFWYFR